MPETSVYRRLQYKHPERRFAAGRPVGQDQAAHKKHHTTMKTKSILLLVTTALFALSTTSPAQNLHRSEVNEKNPGGKDLVMKLEEVRRDAKTSEVKVTQTSGASVASSMFILRGCYDIAKARDAAFFIKLKETKAADGSTLLLLGFTNDNKIDPKAHFDLKEALPDNDEHQFMSVKELEALFGKKP